MQTGGIDSTRKNLSRLWSDSVVRAREPRQGVEKNDDILSGFDQPLRFLEHHVGNLNMTRCTLVECRADDLGLCRALDHLRHFLGPLIDQQNDRGDLRMIFGDRVRDLFEQDRLARARWRHDESALSLADRRKNVDHAHRQVTILRLEPETCIRIPRPEVVERNARLDGLRILAVDAFHLEKREVPLPCFRWTNLPAHEVTSEKAESLYLRRRDVDVIRSGE